QGLARGTADPRHRSASVGVAATPVRIGNYIIAVAQRRDNPVAADQAIVLGDDATDPHAAVAPGHCPAVAVPARTLDHVIAIVQDDDEARVAHIIPQVAAGDVAISGVAADETIGLGDDAADSRCAAAPRDGSAVAV